MAATIKLANLVDAIEMADDSITAYVCLESGETYLLTEFGDPIDEIPDDLDDKDKYLALPHRKALGLGSRTVFRFAERFFAGREDEIRDMFRRKGGFARFKAFLSKHDAFRKWHEFERQETEEAMRSWCEDNSIELSQHGKGEPTVKASCHCGAVRLEIDTAPDTVTDCACSICRRKGALWAYYSPKQVRIQPASGATTVYIWGDKKIEFHSCKICACSTHWAPIDKTFDRMGVNARMMNPEVLAAARLRKISGPD